MLHKAQSISYLYILGPTVSIIYVLRALGLVPEGPNTQLFRNSGLKTISILVVGA